MEKNRYQLMLKVVLELVEKYQLEGKTTITLLTDLPEAIKIYKKGYRFGWSYEAIKAECKAMNHSVGGWLYELAEEYVEKEQEL